MRTGILWAAACGFVAFVSHPSFATDLPDASGSGPAPFSFFSYHGGNDVTRFEIAPNWSKELGFSLRGAFGSHVTNDVAVGFIVEYGQGKREYLTNAGFRLSDKISVIGSVGMLEEHREFVADAGKETVQQMEYGLSLKGAYDVGMFRGFELNGYAADANAKSDAIETGKLFGAQIMTGVDLTDSTRLKIGGGYEWLHWDDGENDNAITFRAEGTQQILDRLSAVAHVKLGASEYVYGAGLNYDLGERAQTNVIGLAYDYIEGQHGIQNDQRIVVSWQVGLGMMPNSQAPNLNSKMTKASANMSAVSVDKTSSLSSHNLLADVMTRPEFLPQRVLARARTKSGGCDLSQYIGSVIVDGSGNLRLVQTGTYPPGANDSGIFNGNPMTITWSGGSTNALSDGFNAYSDGAMDISGGGTYLGGDWLQAGELGVTSPVTISMTFLNLNNLVCTANYSYTLN